MSSQQPRSTADASAIARLVLANDPAVGDLRTHYLDFTSELWHAMRLHACQHGNKSVISVVTITVPCWERRSPANEVLEAIRVLPNLKRFEVNAYGPAGDRIRRSYTAMSTFDTLQYRLKCLEMLRVLAPVRLEMERRSQYLQMDNKLQHLEMSQLDGSVRALLNLMECLKPLRHLHTIILKSRHCASAAAGPAVEGSSTSSARNHRNQFIIEEEPMRGFVSLQSLTLQGFQLDLSYVFSWYQRVENKDFRLKEFAVTSDSNSRQHNHLVDQIAAWCALNRGGRAAATAVYDGISSSAYLKLLIQHGCQNANAWFIMLRARPNVVFCHLSDEPRSSVLETKRPVECLEN